MEETKVEGKKDKVFEKIKQYEALGGENFFNDLEDDPPSKTLMPKDVDYLKKRLSSKIKNFFCRRIVKKMLYKFAVDQQVTVEGIENLQNLKTGAILTTNHFHYFDSAPVIYAVKNSKIKKKMYIVIREGNYQFNGLFGFLLRNYYTFPLSSNMQTTINLNKAIDKVLSKGELVLVYPEQALWWKYKKPRAYRVGAYRWAIRNNVPVIPCFTTMEDMDKIDPEDGLYVQKFTLHIGKPIYADKNLTAKDNAQMMLKKNHDFAVQTYEKVYGTKYDLNV